MDGRVYRVYRVCRLCGERWNVSAVYPGDKKYVCPWCSAREKAKEDIIYDRDQSYRRHAGGNPGRAE